MTRRLRKTAPRRASNYWMESVKRSRLTRVSPCFSSLVIPMIPIHVRPRRRTQRLGCGHGEIRMNIFGDRTKGYKSLAL